MSLDLLSMLGAARPTSNKPGAAAAEGADTAAADAGAAFASLLASVGQVSVESAGNGAATAAGAAPTTPDTAAAAEAPTTGGSGGAAVLATASAAVENSPQVTVLPSDKQAVEAWPMGNAGPAATAPQPPYRPAMPGIGTPPAATAGEPADAATPGRAVQVTPTSTEGPGLPVPTPATASSPTAQTTGATAPPVSPEVTETAVETTPRSTPETAGTENQTRPQGAPVAGSAELARAVPRPAGGQHPGADVQAPPSVPMDGSGALEEPESTAEPAPSERGHVETRPLDTAVDTAETQPQPAAQEASTAAEASTSTHVDAELATTVAAARAASTTHQASQPAPHTPVDPAQIQAQVTRALAAQGALRGGDQTVNLQLDPEHLGKVQVKLTAQGDRLEVVFTAESPEAELALREGARDLARTLGVRADGRWQHVEVKVAESTQNSADPEDSGGDEPDDQRQQRDQREQRRDQNQQDPRQRRRPGR